MTFLVAREFLQNGETRADCNNGQLFLCKPYIPKVIEEKKVKGGRGAPTELIISTGKPH